MKRAALFIAASIAAFILAGVPAALAQEAAGPEEGFSAYAVARVKVLDGSVWVRPSDGGDWEEFSTNSPIPPGSRVSVPEGSEAELQFHGGQFVLLTSGTDLEVRELREGRSDFRLRAGEIRFDLPADDFAPVTVRLPGGGIARFPEPGRQWLTVTEDDETRLVVRRGEAVVALDGEEYPLSAGEEAFIGEGITIGQYRGDEVDTASAPPPPEPEGDMPPVVVNELREYGEWIDVPTYGHVWRPRVAVGWSPYVYGRWAWISPYGWTWVSNEPWGWYPYRCGYWVTDPVFGWFWSPYNTFVSVNFGFGSHRYRHHNVYFRPATVRFIPEGRNVRWVPLRPGERFRPAAYHRGDTRLSQWNRPLDSGRVFVRGGQDRRQWRDYKTVHAERQAEIRKTRTAQPRTDIRRVRPEARDSRPPTAVGGRKGAAPGRSDRDLRDRGNRYPLREDRGFERRPSVPSGGPGRGRGGSVVPQRGIGVSREAVPGTGQVERQAPPARSVPAVRPPSGERGRRPGPMIDRSEAPPARPEGSRGIVQERGPAVRSPVRSVPATRPPVSDRARRSEPMFDRSETPFPRPESRRGIVQERGPAVRSPVRSVPATRPPVSERVRRPEPMFDRPQAPPARPQSSRAIVQERGPAVRGPAPAPRAQGSLGNRGGGDVVRGGDRGGGRWDSRGADRGGERGGGGRGR